MSLSWVLAPFDFYLNVSFMEYICLLHTMHVLMSTPDQVLPHSHDLQSDLTSLRTNHHFKLSEHYWSSQVSHNYHDLLSHWCSLDQSQSWCNHTIHSTIESSLQTSSHLLFQYYLVEEIIHFLCHDIWESLDVIWKLVTLRFTTAMR